jgi:hypothetical protein
LPTGGASSTTPNESFAIWPIGTLSRKFIDGRPRSLNFSLPGGFHRAINSSTWHSADRMMTRPALVPQPVRNFRLADPGLHCGLAKYRTAASAEVSSTSRPLVLPSVEKDRVAFAPTILRLSGRWKSSMPRSGCFVPSCPRAVSAHARRAKIIVFVLTDNEDLLSFWAKMKALSRLVGLA